MTITASAIYPTESMKMASGSHLDDAASPAALSVSPGFNPRYIRIENETDRIAFEWFYGMTSTYMVKTIANGTRSLETSAGVTVTASGTGSAASFGCPILQNKQYRWVALG
jgi:hypothetical protein